MKKMNYLLLHRGKVRGFLNVGKENRVMSFGNKRPGQFLVKK